MFCGTLFEKHCITLFPARALSKQVTQQKLPDGYLKNYHINRSTKNARDIITRSSRVVSPQDKNIAILSPAQNHLSRKPQINFPLE